MCLLIDKLARALTILCLSGFFLACSHVSQQEKEPIVRDDPWEASNRKVMAFNDQVDKAIMKPVATAYKNVTPAFLDKGITNFFSNLTELPTMGNSVLQLDSGGLSLAVFRFTINSTIGLFGFFDVAAAIGLDQQKEDFGQTMAVWGVPEGPYVVLPFLGPSTVRGTGGWIVDIYADPVNVDDTAAKTGLWALKLTDTRADLLKAEELISGDRYIFLRNAYFQNRQYKIHNGDVKDSFGEQDFEEGDDWLE